MVKQTAKRIVGIALGICVIVFGFFWLFCRIDVPADKCLVLVAKSGDPLPPGQLVADKPGQKGIQAEALGPGRYFLIPWKWETKIVDLTEISAGDPKTWQMIYEAGAPDYSIPRQKGKWPEIGVVTSYVGKKWDKKGEIVDRGYQGIQREVITPGTYRINPRAYEINKYPAVVVPIGCVGVVKSQVGDLPGTEQIIETSFSPDAGKEIQHVSTVQKLAEPGQRGVLKNVLPPGLYFLNPKVHRVLIVQIGYNQISQFKTDGAIAFPASDGFTISVDVTVVWGRSPEDTPVMVNRLGDVAKLKQIILNQIRGIARTIGSQYASTDFIEGDKRELYQRQLTETLRKVCEKRDIEILIALVQNVEVSGGSAVSDGFSLKEEIQQGHIAKEQNITKKKQQETARVKADLEEAQIQIEVERENIIADTRKVVAEIRAEGEKKAEEINAQQEFEVAQIERKIAEIDAQKNLVLGRAEAEVEQLRKQAEADGKRMFVQAFGSGQAYNLYTFAQNFQPESIRLIFAGEGTLWTDLSRLQDAAAVELLQSANEDDE